MLKLVLLLAVAALSAAANVPWSDDDDLDNYLENDVDTTDLRMVGGDVVTDTNTYSFMIGIQPKYTLNSVVTNAPFCSGVLIRGQTAAATAGAAPTDQYYVLTSAHCAQSGTSYDFFAGSISVLNTQTASQAGVLATTAIINEEFRQTSMTGDLALIPTTIVPSTTGTAPITAATLGSITDSTKSYLINSVTMAGWGYPNDVFLDHSPRLRALSSWVVPNWYCAVRHLSMPIRRTHVCTAGLPNKGPCTGDSGAPLIAETSGTSSSGSTTRGRVVIGLATHTPRNGCNRGRPGVFTRIGDYLNWIIQVTNYNPDD
ncbi:chymotrypsin-like [Thrips palmi]|uniref:Chymotrypsin-like n=1 Tax=Thrips palmi TaxID=161013 RepID=A0A6P8ZRX4_THRPL|nr:chymotrypsin-like [Thrips palmi]